MIKKETAVLGSLLNVSLGLYAALSSAPVIAQAEPGQSVSHISEVVVTARRREEELQSVPVAMTAISGDAIADMQIQRSLDLQYIVPSLTIVSPFGAEITNITLRGLRNVTTYFAEVPSVLSGEAVMVDLENVQVLNGPQGTLFGQNATGGAILFQPRRPKEEFGGYIRAGIGRYDRRAMEGAINIPLVEDKLFARVSAAMERQDGYTKVISRDYYADDKHWSYLRASLLWRPTESFENYLMADSYLNNRKGYANLLDAVRPGGNVDLIFGPQVGPILDQQHTLLPRKTQGTNIDDPLQRNRIKRIIDIATFDFSERMQLKNIASYAVNQAAERGDLDGTTLPLVSVETPHGEWMTNQRTYTNETQLSGQSFDDKLDWVAGFFYLKGEPNGSRVEGRRFFGGLGLNMSETENTTRGVYAQGSYDLSALIENLSITVGYRYNWDKRSTTAVSVNGAGVCTVTGITPGGPCARTESENWSADGWNIGLDYRLSDTVFLYGRVAKAYTAGTFNPDPPTPDLFTVDPEYYTELEIGLKSDWFIGDMQARTNFAVYYGKYQDIQEMAAASFVDPLGQQRIGTFTRNAAKAKNQGFEFQGTLIPIPSLELNAIFSYSDPSYEKFDSVDLAGNPVDLSGRPFKYSAKEKYSVSARYSLPLDPALGEVSLAVDYSYTGPHKIAQDPSPSWTQSSYSLVNVRINWTDIAGSPFDAVLYLTNATDELYRPGAIDIWPSAGYIAQAYNPPRMWGLELTYRFGADRH